MYYSETDTPAMARTSNLNEELGQVRFSVLVISDYKMEIGVLDIQLWTYLSFPGEVSLFRQNRNSDL